ncbi:MAG: class I SAM-dependent rRNA methyltransferase [Alphaproteobacteria bacterium]|nr:class I SAM-dependent rRNA methyltransferase [Alphaproteobacteria bacterium]
MSLAAPALVAGALPPVRLLAGRARRVAAGHPWVFANEIDMARAKGRIEPGSLVLLEDDNGRAIGIATFNPHPLISARLLTRDATATIDADFLAARLARALAVREALYAVPYYRLAHAEADGLPGAIIDRFGDTVVLQLNTAGMERLARPLVAALDRIVAPRTVVLRNDTAVRKLEDLDQYVRVVRGSAVGPIEVLENGCTFFADVTGGQKTGWFYDQRDNRAFAAALARDRRVADFYTYAGGFAVAAAMAGAAHVDAFDRSQPALDLAARAAAASGVDGRVAVHKAETFATLERLAREGTRYGLVIVDPPAFVKSKKDFHAGVRGYRKLARLAAGVVEPGGYLLAASCSHHVDVETFADQVRRGLTDARREGRILLSAGAAPDHPVHPYLPESAYLKALSLQLD